MHNYGVNSHVGVKKRFMIYLDIETIQLFIYFLFFEWKDSKHRDFIYYSENEGFYPDMHQFNMAVYSDINSNNIGHAFTLSKSRDFDDSVFVCLDNKYKLINFLKEYIKQFKNNELHGDTNIFPYEIQLKYMKRELDFHVLHYKNKFNITAKPRDENNSKETTACGLRIFEFLLSLYFHKKQYLKITSCNRILYADKHLHLENKFFNIALEVQFTKSIDEIFEELYSELKLQKDYRYEIITEDGVDNKGNSVKGLYQVFCKNGQRSRFSQTVHKTVFEYFVDTYKSKVVVSKDIIFEDLRKIMEQSEPITPESLKRYLTAVNRALKNIHSGEKPYIKAKGENLTINIPQV